jgi:Tfp pilus assembly major pilin PilA
MARARFTEVTSALDGVKKQVELCIFDLGPAFAQNAAIDISGCIAGAAQAASGNGWRILPPAQYATKYVATITVNENWVTATAVNNSGLGGATYSIAPMWGAANNGIIDWVRADGTAYGAHPAVGNANAQNTCIAQDLC